MKRKYYPLGFCTFLIALILLQQSLNAQPVIASKGQSMSAPVADTSPTAEERLELKEFLEKTGKEHNWKFVYHPELLKAGLAAGDAGITVDSIDELSELLKKYNLRIRKIGERQFAILVSGRSETSQALSSGKVLQDAEVRGTITDTSGVTMPGVSVTVKNTTGIGTSTDLNGKYILDVPDNAILVFSFMGYKTLEIPVNGREVIDVVLHAEDSELDEVVVVGFGTQRKITTIGAQSTISPSELKQPVRNLTTVLAGRISGIISVQRSGEPGYDNANLWVRGVSTFTGTSPLVLVDGVERSFANIDPEDIESFSILKDASATAVYGVRGANGVILITTKRGKPGKPEINAGFNQGVTRFTLLPEFVDGVTYMQMANEAHATRGKIAPYSEERIAKTQSGEDPYLYPNVNWMDEIFNDFGSNSRVNLNINGGSENANYYISTSYYNEKGLFNRDELNNYNSAIKTDRYNFTSNLNLNITPTTKLQLGLQGYIMNGNYPGTGTNVIFEAAMIAPPTIYAPKYPDGRIAGLQEGAIENPYDKLTQSGYVTEWRNQLFSNIRATQDLEFWLPGLSVTSMFSFDAYNQHNIRREKVTDTWIATGRDEEGNLLYNQTRVGTEYLNYIRQNGGERQFYTETALNYQNYFGDHGVSGMLIYNQTDKIPGFADDFILSLPFRNRGLAGRATYAYADKYLFEFNFGYNGSENFSPGRRYGFFPSLGVGWVASEEKFFEPLKNVFQFVKFRFSHGKAGNSNIDPDNNRRFAYIGTVTNTTGYQFGREYDKWYDGLDIGEYASDVSWEISTKTNMGVDFYTLNNSLYMQVDWFREHREGIFLRRSSVPAYLGLLSNPYGNLGVTENSGFDATMEYNKQFNKLTFGVRGTFTYARNKVIDDDLPPWQYPWLERKGLKIGQRFGYIAEGLFRSDEEVANSARQVGDVRAGDIKFRDMNGDGLIDAYDQYPIGYGSIPEIVYGFGLTVGYKGFSMGAFFQGIGNVDILLNGEGLVPFQQGGNRGNLLAEIENRWTTESPDPDVFYPRLTFGDENHNYRTSSWWVKNGRYLRLKTLELGYQFPDRWFEPLGVKGVRIYALGYNVFTFSPFELWDVELGDGRGADYPNLSSYNIGVDFSF